MRRKTWVVPALALAAAVLFFTGQLAAQAVYGTIAGRVTDESGAVLPGVEVVISNVAKGTSWTVVTDDSGNYRRERLVPGPGYEVSASLAGFKSFRQQNVTVSVDTVVDVNVVLQVGEITEQVTVTGAPPLLKTEKTDVAVTFEEKQIEELPIFERNFTRFLLLTPGTQELGWQHASSENPQGSRQIMVNGQHFSGTGFELDGTSNRDPILGIIVINPTLEGVTEAKVTAQNYDAEFGQATSGVVTAQTKSGTNEIHGSAFLFRRNDEQQARDPFAQASGVIPDTLWNQFGGSVGGPIVKDKAFFFFDYQGTRRKNGGSVLTTVPTALARTGDLSEYRTFFEGRAIYDPLTGDQASGTGRTEFAGGVIPQNRLSPQALALINQLPLPNRAGVQQNYEAGGIEAFDDNAFNVRGDWAYSSNLHIFGRYSFAQFERSGPGAFGELLGGPSFNNINFAGSSRARNQSVASGFDYTLSPTLLTDFRFGFFRYHVNVLPGGVGTTPAADIGIPNLNSVAGINQDPIFTSGLPYFDINGVTGSDQIRLGYSLGANSCNCPLEESEQQWQWVSNWIKSSGDHTLKFGADIRWAQNRRIPSDRHRAGELSFSVGRTADGGNGGLGLATFLLGDVTFFSRYVSPTTDAEERQKRWFFYGQDTWKINDKLTFNYGLRWEIYFPETVTLPGRGGWLDVNTGEIRVGGVGGIGLDGDIENSFTNLAPRLGLTYQISEKSVLRMGYGRSFDLGVFGSTFGHAVTQNLPVLAIQENNTSSFGSVFNLSQGPATPPFPEPDANGRFPLPDGVNSFVRPEKVRIPTLDAWNVTYQTEIPGNLVWELGYVGNKGTHVFAGDGPDYNFNQPIIDANPAAPGLFSPINGRRPFFSGPINGFGGNFGWTQGFRYFGNDSSNNYHALQTKIEKRFSDGYSILAHYTWSRARKHQGDYYIWDSALNYGPTDQDRTHAFVVNSLIELPFGRGKRYGTDISKGADYALGGWQVNFTMTWSSGLPFNPTHANCGSLRDTGPCRPNQIGDPQIIGRQRAWFTICDDGGCPNSSVWGIPSPGTFGSLGYNEIRGPGFFDTNLSIFKNFSFGENIGLQFRAEIFNLFNHVNWNNPNSCIDCGSRDDGAITSLFAGAAQRRVQWGLRLQF